MFDIDQIDDSCGSSDAVIPDPDGEFHKVTFHYRRPDHLDLIQAEYETSSLDEKLREYREKLRKWREKFEERTGYSVTEIFDSDDLDSRDYDFSGRPEFRIAAEEYKPRIDFCRRFITSVNGISSDGEPVDWPDLPTEAQSKILRLAGAEVVVGLYGEIKSQGEISPEEKKG